MATEADPNGTDQVTPVGDSTNAGTNDLVHVDPAIPDPTADDSEVVIETPADLATDDGPGELSGVADLTSNEDEDGGVPADTAPAARSTARTERRAPARGTASVGKRFVAAGSALFGRSPAAAAPARAAAPATRGFRFHPVRWAFTGIALFLMVGFFFFPEGTAEFFGRRWKAMTGTTTPAAALEAARSAAAPAAPIAPVLDTAKVTADEATAKRLKDDLSALEPELGKAQVAFQAVSAEDLRYAEEFLNDQLGALRALLGRPPVSFERLQGIRGRIVGLTAGAPSTAGQLELIDAEIRNLRKQLSDFNAGVTASVASLSKAIADHRRANPTANPEEARQRREAEQRAAEEARLAPFVAFTGQYRTEPVPHTPDFPEDRWGKVFSTDLVIDHGKLVGVAVVPNMPSLVGWDRKGPIQANSIVFRNARVVDGGAALVGENIYTDGKWYTTRCERQTDGSLLFRYNGPKEWKIEWRLLPGE